MISLKFKLHLLLTKRIGVETSEAAMDTTSDLMSDIYPETVRF